MHVKRCAVQPDLDDAGTPRVRRTVRFDPATGAMRRLAIVQDALVTFGHGSRDIVANVLVDGIDLDALLPELEAGEIVMASMVIEDGGQGDLPVIYRLTNAFADPRPHHAHRIAA